MSIIFSRWAVSITSLMGREMLRQKKRKSYPYANTYTVLKDSIYVPIKAFGIHTVVIRE